MMEQSKKSSLMVARSILNNKLISKKLEHYLKVRRGYLEQASAAFPTPGPGSSSPALVPRILSPFRFRALSTGREPFHRRPGGG